MNDIALFISFMLTTFNSKDISIKMMAMTKDVRKTAIKMEVCSVKFA